jgi:hypothetical protein
MSRRIAFTSFLITFISFSSSVILCDTSAIGAILRDLLLVLHPYISP